MYPRALARTRRKIHGGSKIPEESSHPLKMEKGIKGVKIQLFRNLIGDIKWTRRIVPAGHPKQEKKLGRGRMASFKQE